MYDFLKIKVREERRLEETWLDVNYTHVSGCRSDICRQDAKTVLYFIYLLVYLTGLVNINKHWYKCTTVGQEVILNLWNLDRCYKVTLNLKVIEIIYGACGAIITRAESGFTLEERLQLFSNLFSFSWRTFLGTSKFWETSSQVKFSKTLIFNWTYL